MKLRNKKTGEIIESACIGVFKHKSSGDCERVDTEARSLEKVLEEWEDYTPAEPLIKDDKIRKAIRAWAEAIETNEVVISYSRHDFLNIIDTNADSDICFDYELGYTYNEDTYSITELCGEEEE